MESWNLPLALLDIVPVVLFFMGYVNLLKAFYPRMTPAQYSMLSSGGMMVFLAGFLKVIWKFLYVLEICDYAMISDAFFPIQSVGFMLLAVGMILHITGKKSEETETDSSSNSDYENFSVVPLVTTKVPFIILTAVGTLFFYGSLALLGTRQKNKINAVFFISAYAFNLIQAMFSVKFDHSMAVMHWLAEMVNILAQLCMWLGSRHLRKGYEDERYGY